jgi:RND family efflux transporter MFP subunit
MIRYFFSVLLTFVSCSVYAADNQPITTPVAKTTVPVIYQSQGFIEAVHKATMKAETSGRLAQVYFDVDDIVAKGAIIARFRNTRQKAELDLAQAGLEEAEAEHNRSLADFERVQDLYEKKLVAVSALDKANADLKTAKARLDAAAARIKKAEEEYENTIIRAPYSGIVTKRHVEVGEAVNPGSPLVSGISLDLIRAVVDIPQAYVDSVRANKRVIIYLSAGRQLSSEKITVFPYANEKSHTFRVRVELPRGIEGVYPGMMVKLGFVVEQKEVLAVPKSAIVNRGEISAVYVQHKDGHIAMRQVRLGENIDDRLAAVQAGLSINEPVFNDPHAATVALKRQLEKIQK